ncbi:IS3 family transposase [Gordonia liuliyuniae]|uniref:IS3 family transposase n=1 Tax=Gordonia liuliyuniae TaxID=2911517 RepID=A0ABS9IWC1_9ACTN|nr:IS3 family transposase [Gordonia liuliyuniae]MCF8589853.1 IS3 family transposase [Gordonia liuliyuniae]
MIAAEGLAVQIGCRVLRRSEMGFYNIRTRAPSERSIRHAMLTDIITEIHTKSHDIYGARRIHAELTNGHGILGGHGQVEMLMQRAGLQGIIERRKRRQVKPHTIAIESRRVGLQR